MAGNFNKSNFGKNRYSTDIVYPSTTGDYELTKEEFLASNPDLTEADFAYWKSWSDSDYLMSDRKDTVESKRTRTIEQFADTELLSVESCEETVLEIMEPTVNPYTREKAMRILDLCLTAVQKSRYLGYYEKDKTTAEIAEDEGVTEQAVSKSLAQARKNILSFLLRMVVKHPLSRTIGEGQ